MYVWCAGHGHGEACSTWPHHQGRPGGVQDVGHCVQRTGQCGPVLPVQLQVGLVNPSGGLWRGGAGMHGTVHLGWLSSGVLAGASTSSVSPSAQEPVIIYTCPPTHPPNPQHIFLMALPKSVRWCKGAYYECCGSVPYCQPLAGRTSCTRRVMIPEAKAAGRTVRPAGLVANKAMPHLGRLLCC